MNTVLTGPPLASVAAPNAEILSAAPSLLDQILEQQAVVASRYQPVMEIDDAIKRYEALRRYIEKVLVEDNKENREKGQQPDYGRVPGVEKPFLFKSGAQKLCMLFGYVPHYEAREQIEDWSGVKFGEPLFYYQYVCTLTKDGNTVGEGIGSCNSWESKYRYRWVPQDQLSDGLDKSKLVSRGGIRKVFEFDFAIEKAETTGKYGKPAEYWQRFRDAIEVKTAKRGEHDTKNGSRPGWEIEFGEITYRIPNDNFPDVINTCQKQAEKRSYVEAVLSATGASQFFTQDEDVVRVINGETREELIQHRIVEEQSKLDKTLNKRVKVQGTGIQSANSTPQSAATVQTTVPPTKPFRVMEQDAGEWFFLSEYDTENEALLAITELKKQNPARILGLSEGKSIPQAMPVQGYKATDDDIPRSMGGTYEPSTGKPAGAEKVKEMRQHAATPQLTKDDYRKLRMDFLEFGDGGVTEFDRTVLSFGAKSGDLFPPTLKKAQVCYAALVEKLEGLRGALQDGSPDDLFGGLEEKS